ncbi:BTAD domain-containing putative transcriptional regulator [Streptomyces sp. 549]|uniref:AfsR/SARP family transcriptional regulator n=1 Tax=Streptomyces sp. 549 TaxID=3049076 RepID=UPI0024C278C3|nr:BTAD domain-containing putative transcriptional regulator [Streptomyces sp. 549]MDK1474588.1 BTAD domain-containing putative transcriptional regulator [Streptomyces sp. 549]
MNTVLPFHFVQDAAPAPMPALAPSFRLPLAAATYRSAAVAQAPSAAGDTRTGEDDPAAALRFGLLGPVEVLRADGSPVDLGPRQRRLLLVRLLTANGRPVPLDRLCHDVWAGRPPAGAVSAVHAHVSRLRGALEPGRPRNERPRVLVSGPCGYTLHVPAAARDTVRFGQLTEEARQRMADGGMHAALDILDRAMRLWRGPALEDARDHEFALRETARWDEAVFAARELRVSALVGLGACLPAVLDARALTEDQPLRESAWALLMRALHGAGRTAEALLEFNRLRTVLQRELSLEPGPELCALRDAVHQHSPALTARRPGLAALAG